MTAKPTSMPGTFTASSGGVPLPHLSCQQDCDAGSCAVTCPVDETLSCPGGGTATDVGVVQGTLDAMKPLTAMYVGGMGH